MKFAGFRRRDLLAVGAVGGAVLAIRSVVGGRRPKSGAPVRLRVANSQWLDAVRGIKLWSSMRDYQSAAPHVVMEQEAIPSSQISTKLIMEFAGGQGPDIAIVDEGFVRAIADAGFLLDVGEVVESQSGLNETNDSGIINGRRLGIGWQRAAYALVYNKVLLAKAGATVPSTVDELIASAKAVSAATGAIGFSARYQIADLDGWFADFQNWAYGYGASWAAHDGKLTIDTPRAVAAVAAFKKVYDSGIIPLGDDFITQRLRFKQRQVAFSIDNSGGTLNLATGGPIASAEIGAAPLPFPYPGAHQQYLVTVNAASRHKTEALDFLRWLISPPTQQALREASGPDELATDVPLAPAFRAANPWADTFVTLAKPSRGLLIPGHEADSVLLMRIIMQAVERVILADDDPESALAQAQRQVDARF